MTNNPLIPRSLAPILEGVARDFPAVILTGPRQSGKTTLLGELFGATHRVVSLEALDVRDSARSDPRGFLSSFPPPVVYDEIQHAPFLLPYIKERIDSDRGAQGRFLLTGSQNILLMQEVSETLAGRAAVLHLLPLAARERHGAADRALAWTNQIQPVSPPSAPKDAVSAWREILRGGYPELWSDPHRDAWMWHESYLRTYIERDVRTLRQVGDLGQFQSFVKATAARSGQLLNLSELARDLGIAVNTAKLWISVLEASFQVLVVRPYFANVGKRLVKSPKLYWLDTGLLSHLVGLRDGEHAAQGPMSGALFETFVVSEVHRSLTHAGTAATLWFWRTATGSEVDLIVEHEGTLVPLEIKATLTPRPAMAAGIEALKRDLGARVAPGYVVHLGDATHPLGPNATALPVWSL